MAFISFAHKMIFANRHKRMNRLIVAVEQVPGHKIVKCKTDNNGEFSISISNIREFQEKDAKEIKFKITVQSKKIKVMVIKKTNFYYF